jgi:probable rRNA maturation factor
MMEVAVSGEAIPRFSRAAIGEFVTECIQAIRKARAAPFQVGEVSIVLVDDKEMRALNRQYRRKDKTTDVLTFPAEDTESPDSQRQLGDIIVSVEQARRQATEEGHSLAIEVRYLVLHGLLHAYGYDHDADAGEMNALELKLRKRVGLD